MVYNLFILQIFIAYILNMEVDLTGNGNGNAQILFEFIF
jgi:hypothetical protein